MPETTWSHSEKTIARRVFDAALQRELSDIMTEFKRRAAEAKVIEDVWGAEEYLTRMRKEINFKYDYRYSQLCLVFGGLLREGRISEHDLKGLSDEHLTRIRRIASL